MTEKNDNTKISATAKKTVVKKTAATAKAPTTAARVVKTTAKPATAAKKTPAGQADKKDKVKKVKMIRDSYSMPESDYTSLIALKKQCLAGGVAVKKSELLRAGLQSLAKLSNAALLAAVKPVVAGK